MNVEKAVSLNISDTLHRSREKIQHQFGSHADEYLASPIHSHGESLQRLVDVIQPAADWKVLDIAAGPGHTGLVFADKVKQVILSGLTWPMLALSRNEADERLHTNVHLCQTAAEELPFAPLTFDLITCRLGAHHFNDIEGFLREARRSLKPGGTLAVVDNIVPDRPPSRKGKLLHRDTGRYINALERLRDSSHNRCLSIEEWRESLFALGLKIWHSETIEKEISFDSWVVRSQAAADDRLRLKAMILQAPQGALEHLKPTSEGRDIYFTLIEMVLICKNI